MNKTIFAERKELKKNAHKVIRSHFVVLVFLMLVLVLFGTEFRTSLSGWGQNQLLSSSDADTETDAGNDPGNMLAVVDTFSISDVIEGIWNDDLTKETSKAAARERKLREKLGNSKALGMTNGVLGQVVGSIASGAFLVRLGQTIRTVTQSGRITGIIFTVGAFLWYALGFILLKNVCSAIVRRLFLEARIYSRVFFGDAGWFATVRKWLRASWTMFVKYVYITLWSLTIVGGVIKFFSYWAVPYIVAENPSLTSGEAISLSRKMMNGHKVELLEYYITLWGWVLLGAVTLGLSDLVYGNAYRMCCYTEFYARVREEFLQREPENAGLLNDEYLFRQADRITLYETYFDVVDEVVLIHEGKVELSGWRKKVADWFGIWLYTVDKKKAYDEQEGRKFALEHDRQCMRGEAYPQRLNPLYKEKRPGKPVKVSFLRNYTVWTLFLLFITFCFVGWSWEVALHFMQTGQFANRGTLHGPWLPIYGAGGVIVLIFCSRFLNLHHRLHGQQMHRAKRCLA